MVNAEHLASHEEAFIIAFVRREKRGRFRALLSDPRRRAKILSTLAHQPPLDQRFMHPIDRSNHNPEAIEKLLRTKGARGTCDVLSEWALFDGLKLPLRSALEHVVGAGMGTVISCISGRLAYYEGEDPGERYILERAF